MMSSQLGLIRKVIFSLMAVIMFFCFAEIAARTYHFLKYKDPSAYIYGFKTLKNAIKDLLYSTRTADIYDYAGTESVADEVYINRRRYYAEPLKTNKPFTFIIWGYPAHINNLEFRGPDINIDKPVDIIRIAMMGGSFVQCVGVGDSETWEVLLQKRLDENAAMKYEILNTGIGASNMNHILDTYVNRITKLRPDYALLISNYNNHKYIRVTKMLPLSWRISKFLYNVSRFYAMIREYVSCRVYKDNNYFLYNYEVQIMPEDVNNLIRRYQKRLDQILTVSKENNIKLIIGTQPIHIPLGLPDLQNIMDENMVSEIGNKINKNKKLTYYELEYYLQGLLNNEASKFAKKNNIPLFDGVSFFPREKQRYFIDQIHLSPRGTELFAEALCKFLLHMESGSK